MTDSTDVLLAVAIAEIERLRARIAELEAALHRRGSLAVTPETSGPIAENYPPMRTIDG